MIESNWNNYTLEVTCDAVVAIIDTLIDGNKVHADMANKSYLERKNIADYIMRDKTEYCIKVLNLLRDEVIKLKGGESENDQTQI